MGNQTKPIHLDFLTRLRQARGPSQAWARQLLLTGGDDCDDLHGNNDAGDDDNYNGDGILISGKAEWLLSLVHLAGRRSPLPSHRLLPLSSLSLWWIFMKVIIKAITVKVIVTQAIMTITNITEWILLIPIPRSSTEFFSLAKGWRRRSMHEDFTINFIQIGFNLHHHHHDDDHLYHHQHDLHYHHHDSGAIWVRDKPLACCGFEGDLWSFHQ